MHSKKKKNKSSNNRKTPYKNKFAKFETTSKLELTEGVTCVPLACMHLLPKNSIFHYLLWHACALYQEIVGIPISFTCIQSAHY